MKRRNRWPIVLSLAAIGVLTAWGHSAVNLGRTRRAAEADDLTAAARYLDASLRFWPAGVESNRLGSQIARRSGNLERAKELLAKCGDDCSFERDLIQAQEGGLGGDREAKLFALLNENHPDSALIREALARGFIANRDMGRLAALVEQWPDSQAHSGWRGRAYYFLGKLPEAIADLASHLERHPTNDDARAELALSYFHAGYSADGRHHGRIVADRAEASTSTSHLLNLGLCLHDQALFQDELDVLDRLLKREPGHQPAAIERARALMRLSRAADGERAAREVLAGDPYAEDAYLVLARCLAMQDRTAEAQEAESRWQMIDAARYHLNSVMPRLASAPEPAILSQAAASLARLGQTERMLEACQAALALDPAHRETHRVLAEHFERTGQAQRAKDHREAAAKP